MTLDAPAAADRRRTYARLGTFAAVYTYALIVFGGIVRITGSGMGCGDDWPRCNGSWLPPFELTTWIEWGHRLLAAGAALPFLALFLYAVRHRDAAGFGGRGGLLRPALLATALLVPQALLGAVTVKLDLHTGVTATHFATASLILAALVTGVVRAIRPIGAGRASRAVMTAAGLALVVVAFGALTANTDGAPLACQGFPLCNGAVAPDGGAVVWLHWSHRLLAFALLFLVAYRAWRTRAPGTVPAERRAARVAASLVVLQVIVAAALVLLGLPDWLQALHLAVGVAVWVAIIVWLAVSAPIPAPARERVPVAA